MSTIENLIQARAEIEARKSANDSVSLRPVPNLPRSVAEHHRNLEMMAGQPTPRADVALAQAKELFSVGNMASKFRMAYNSLTVEQRALILVSANIDPKKTIGHQMACTMNFQDFDIPSRTAICDGLKVMGALTQRFHRAVGSLKDLRTTMIH